MAIKLNLNISHCIVEILYIFGIPLLCYVMSLLCIFKISFINFIFRNVFRVKCYQTNWGERLTSTISWAARQKTMFSSTQLLCALINHSARLHVDIVRFNFFEDTGALLCKYVQNILRR